MLRRQRKLSLRQLRKEKKKISLRQPRGKRDTLAQRAESLPHQKMRGELMWIGLASGSTLLQGTSVMMS
eukprot:77534-Pelagomonas_calceolata.AAC.1